MARNADLLDRLDALQLDLALVWGDPVSAALLSRPGIDSEVIAQVPELAGRIHMVPIPEMAIASSDLRARVAEGRPIAFQVPWAVEEFIVGEGLYRMG